LTKLKPYKQQLLSLTKESGTSVQFGGVKKKLLK